MQFTELMLIYTPAIFWNEPPDSAPQKASGLRDFLLYLLAPDKAGIGALYSYGSSSQDGPNWLSDGEAASDWVRATYDNIWNPQAEALLAGHVKGSQVLGEYSKHKAELFLDRERLVACFEHAEIKVDVPKDIFVGLSVDWAGDDEWLWWTPQLRICNYWPHNRHYAPPKPPDTPAKSSSLTLESAADILYKDFWYTVESAFGQLSIKYLEHIGLTLELTPEIVFPPVYFYARPEPNLVLDMPEDFVSPQHLPELQKLARRIAGIEDLLSAEVAGALLEGTILTFRREVETRFTDENARLETSWRSHYLLVPWLLAATTECAEEAENEACLVARWLVICEFVAGGQRHMNILKDILKPMRSLYLLNNAAEEAVRLVSSLQRQIAFESKSRVRHDAYEVVRQLHSSIFRLGIDLLPRTDKVISKKADWHQITERVIRYTQSRLSIRVLPSIRSLSESLASSRAHMEVTGLLENLVQEVHKIQNYFRSVTVSLQDILEQERREIEDRENVRQRLISYVIAALAAVTVFPLLIGQTSWAELRQEMEAWPSYLRWFGDVYIAPHAYWTLLAMVSATFLIVLLLYALIRMTQKWGGTPEYTKELAKAGKAIGDIVGLIEEKANVARLIEEKEDRQVCEQLIQVVQWLLRKSLDPSHPLDSSYKAISNQVAAFIITTELLTRLPIPKRLPRALCLCRYFDIVQSIDNAAQTDEDFSKALEECGLNSEDVKKIRERAEQYRQQKDWEGLIGWILGDSFKPLNNAGNQQIESPTDPSTVPPLPTALPSASDPSVPVSEGSNSTSASAKQD